jgi:hypothetical protein
MSMFKQSLSRDLQVSMLDLDMAFDASSFVEGFPPGMASGNVSERAMAHQRNAFAQIKCLDNTFAGWYGSSSV